MSTVKPRAEAKPPVDQATRRYRQRLLGYFGLIAALLGGAVILFIVVERLTPFDALYLTISTLTTLGYGDIVPRTIAGRVVTMFTAVSGLLLVFGIGKEIVQESLTSTLEGRDRTLERQLATLRDHHIICGYGRLGEKITDQLLKLDQQVVVIEQEAALAAAAMARRIATVQGDALAQDSLRQAGIARAKSVIATFRSDADNVYLVLECGELRRDIDIISTASGREAARRMYLAGATRVVSPHTVAGEMIAKSAVNPSVLQLMSEVTDEPALSENLTQIVVAPASPLVSKTLKDLPALGLDVKVVAARHGGSITMPHGGDFVIRPGMLLVVAGNGEQLAKMEGLSRQGVAITK